MQAPFVRLVPVPWSVAGGMVELGDDHRWVCATKPWRWPLTGGAHPDTGHRFRWEHEQILPLPVHLLRMIPHVPRPASFPAHTNGDGGHLLRWLARDECAQQGINSALFWAARTVSWTPCSPTWSRWRSPAVSRSDKPAPPSDLPGRR